MPARIETAEVMSYRLKLPRAELSRLPSSVGRLALSLDEDGADTVVSVADSDSYLRFRPSGTQANLIEVFVGNDAGGLFFEKVLIALITRFKGDLWARVVWSSPERNRQGTFEEVRIEKGRPIPMASLAQAASDEPLEEEAPTPFDPEVQESLARARAHWAEYQRLKAKKG